MAAAFPRHPVRVRGLDHIRQHLVSHPRVPVVTAPAAAIGGAVLAAQLQPSAGTLVSVGLAAGAGAYLSVVVVMRLGHVVRYKLSGHQHHNWEVNASTTAGSAVTFSLRHRPGSMPQTHIHTPAETRQLLRLPSTSPVCNRGFDQTGCSEHH